MAGNILRFAQLQSQVDVTFMAELCDHKLDVLKLSEEPVELTGFLHPNRYQQLPSRLQLDVASLRPGVTSRQDCHVVPGQLLLYNTVEGFRGADKNLLMKQAAAQLWADIRGGAAEVQPALLSRFLLLAYGDLKKYDFQYWFAFPALKPPAAFTQLAPPAPLQGAVSAEALQQISDACAAWRRSPAANTAPAAGSDANPAAGPRPPALPSTHAEALALSPHPFWLLSSPDPAFTADVQCHPLSAWGQLTHTTAQGSSGGQQQQQQQQAEPPGGIVRHVLLAFSDPSNLPEHPGWPLRNALLMAAARWGVTELRVLCVRESSRGGGRLDPDRSLMLHVGLPPVPPGWPQGAAGEAGCPEAVGWEANEQGKLLPRSMSLSGHLSPTAQAEQAVDLNLRLMRWRAAPQLDVGALARTKCLLLGAGTLGCAVARTLQAWGVRRITLVDSGRVAFSNPVRQSLFELNDCLAGGRPKAEAAAEALRRIFPSAEAQGVPLSIPMPGHPPPNAQEEGAQQQAFEQLQSLVAQHDVVFLLTDTRESRWLPALLAAAHGRLAITAAVGFDSFLVMRHGAPPGSSNTHPPPPTPAPAPTSTSTAPSEGQAAAANPTEGRAGGAGGCGGGGRRLGCYFCNDVFAPANSTRDRSLDQQCTVARPGLAPVAGALAVELMAAVLQQREGVCAPPPSVQQQQLEQGGGAAPPLGSAPHMVRGQLSSFSQVAMEGWAFVQCTACSEAVVGAFRERGWGLVRAALDSPRHLEELTGLAELHAAAAKLGEADGCSDDEDGDVEGGGGEGRGKGMGKDGGAGEGEGGEEEEEDWTEL